MDKLNKKFAVLVLLALCALIFVSRLHTYDEPLERDLTTYAVIAHEMLQGKPLYSDLWDHKPPAIHVTYAAAELCAGYGRSSILLMNLFAGIATLFACYFAGSAAGGGHLGGLTAAALWALASGDLSIEGNQPNTEVFLNVCLTSAFAILVRAEKNNNRLGWGCILSCGLFFAIASLYKQIALVHAALLAVVYLAWSPAVFRKKAVLQTVLVAGMVAVTWALVFGYFAARGHSQAFIDAVFNYNRWYSANVWQKNLNHLPKLISPDLLVLILCIASLSLMGIVLGLTLGPRRPWNLLLAFLIATQIAVILPGWFFQHYYQLYLPPLVIGAGWGIALLKRILPSGFAWLSYATTTVILATLVLIEVPYYRARPEVWSFKKYGVIFLATESLAHEIDKLLLPNETFYEWGNESGLYFTSRRRPPSGVIFAYPMQGGPLASTLSERLLKDLRQSKPELIVLARKALEQVGSAGPVLDWCHENYRPFCSSGIFVLLARKGGRLDAQQASLVAD